MLRKEDYLHDITQCRTTIEGFQLLDKECRRLGMQNVSWVIKLPLPIDTGRIITFNTYSQSWQDRYWSQNYLAIDPTIKHGLTSMQPLAWFELKNEQPEFWEEARAHGLVEGIAQTVWDRNGACSMLSLSRDSLEFSDAELRDKMPKVVWLAQLVHASMGRMLVNQEVPATASDITKREKEALKRAASGMTSREIAAHMNITKRTADFHLESARNKLGADNRTDAVVRAVVLGLI